MHLRTMPGQFFSTNSRYATDRLTGQQSSSSTILVVVAASASETPSFVASFATTRSHRRLVLACFDAVVAQWDSVFWQKNRGNLARTAAAGSDCAVLPSVM
jgi:hypothetical protein